MTIDTHLFLTWGKSFFMLSIVISKENECWQAPQKEVQISHITEVGFIFCICY